jgi:acetyltransferase
MAVGRLSKLHGTEEARFTMLVNDQFQGHGVGGELLRRLLKIGRDEKLRRVIASISPDNQAMQHVCERLGFKLQRAPGDNMIAAEIDL